MEKMNWYWFVQIVLYSSNLYMTSKLILVFAINANENNKKQLILI